MSVSIAETVRRVLRWEFVPEGALLVGLTAFFLDQPDAATSAFKSTKALAIMGAVTVGWLGARVALARLLPFALARAAVFSVAAAVALSAVVFPAYDNETVIESFPVAAPAAATVPVASPATVPVATQNTPVPSPPHQPKPTSTTTTTVQAATTPVPAAEATAAPSPQTATSDQPGTAAAQPEPAPAVSGPQRLRSGPIRGIDHRASGTAALYRQPDGAYVVGLEDIDIQPGPDYDLYIVPGENRKDIKGGIRLGDLRGNKGTQYYEVPAGPDLENGPWTVLVWCQTFAVPVAGGTPS